MLSELSGMSHSYFLYEYLHDSVRLVAMVCRCLHCVCADMYIHLYVVICTVCVCYNCVCGWSGWGACWFGIMCRSVLT